MWIDIATIDIDTTLITYNRKRLAELVTKFSGIALRRLLFRRLIYNSCSSGSSSRSVKVFCILGVSYQISVQIVVQRADILYIRYAKRNATKGTESSVDNA